MIYKREEYLKEDKGDQQFPVKRIEVLAPVEDEEEGKRFVGQVSLGMQTPMGVQQIPVNFEIEADTVSEAFDNFAEEAKPRIEETRKQLEQEVRKMREQADKKIVRPGEMNLQNQGNVIDFDNLKSD
jgi:hypothetical protein